jgi:oxygen-independent coproporphyrinogen-3 oxidase
MANIYIHYPFCKKACHYCNFHFSTILKNQSIVLEGILKEIEIRSNEIKSPLESIYFGGGSPSILEPKFIEKILNKIFKQYKVKKKLEITLELNPDDFSRDYLTKIQMIGINRISLGVQSFDEFDMELLNRSHSSIQSIKALDFISNLYDNFSIDLIYGIPYSSIEKWENNLKNALKYKPPHLSCYSLTLESNTVLQHKVKNGEIELLDEEFIKEQYDYLVEELEKKGYRNYEFSSFAMPGYYAINNSNYWNGKPYLGIGPSAHSYNGNSIRSWNISNNIKYAKAIMNNILPIKKEKLNKNDLYNEYIMTGLRKEEGVSLNQIRTLFGERYKEYVKKQLKKHIINNNMVFNGDLIKISKKAKFLTDGLSSDLFFIKD